MTLPEVVEPETGQVQGVTSLHPDPDGAGVFVVRMSNQIRIQGIYRDPRYLVHVRDELDLEGFGGLVINVLGGLIVLVVEPGQVRRRMKEDVLIPVNHTVNVLVGILVG